MSDEKEWGAYRAFGVAAPPDGAAHEQWIDFAALLSLSAYRSLVALRVQERIVEAYKSKWEEP